MAETKSPALGTSRWSVETTARLARQRDWAERSPQWLFLLTLVAAREDARYSLRGKVTKLRASLDRLDKVMRAESPSLNELGELQGQPSAVEAAVGAFDAADRALHAYLEAFPATSS